MEELPTEYADCVLFHKDGAVRIGRLAHAGYFELASYQERKVYVVWRPSDVIAWKYISFERPEGE
jgi:hypothetical protein